VNDDFAQATDLEGRAIRATNFLLDHWWLWLILLALLWLVLTIRSQHARVGKLDERADAAFGDIDALLIERHTLIGNLAEVVRAFAAKEHDVIRDVLDARVDALEALSDGASVNATQIAGGAAEPFHGQRKLSDARQLLALLHPAHRSHPH
jgi:LemA protein